MKKQELSEAIREGMNNSREDFAAEILRAVILGIIIFVVGLLIFFFVINPLWDKYDNYKCVKNPEECTPTAYAQASSTPCMYEKYDCSIIDYSQKRIYQKFKIQRPVTYYPIIAEIRACGFSEGNAWFENFKDNYENDSSKLKMVCQ